MLSFTKLLNLKRKLFSQLLILRVLHVEIVKSTMLNVDLFQNALVVSNLVKKTIVKQIYEHLHML